MLYDSDVNYYLADCIASNEGVTITLCFLGSYCSLPRLFLQRYSEI